MTKPEYADIETERAVLLVPDPQRRFIDRPGRRLWRWIEIPPVMAHESLNTGSDIVRSASAT